MHEYEPTEYVNPSSRGLLELEARVDRLSMICCAMWTIVQAHTDLGDEELNRLVRELDMSDGHEDGRANEKQVRDCTTCGRPVFIGRPRCQYCGAPRRSDHPFEGVL